MEARDVEHCQINTHLPLYQVYLFNCLLTQIANQLITRPQINVFSHVDMVKTTCWSSNRASEWMKGDLSHFERGVVAGARRPGL